MPFILKFIGVIQEFLLLCMLNFFYVVNGYNTDLKSRDSLSSAPYEQQNSCK